MGREQSCAAYSAVYIYIYTTIRIGRSAQWRNGGGGMPPRGSAKFRGS